ncbi:hypothetical protein V5799_008047 [Amblyomma americanum]|uniref:Uncharacterized protein n=1 Tax=Amblyomma americanum TaxID=6943 RepID=A0AAQ4FF76_AMBAM
MAARARFREVNRHIFTTGAAKENQLAAAKEAASSPSDTQKPISPVAVNTMKVVVMVVLLSIVCAFGAYFLALKSKEDEPGPEIIYPGDNAGLDIVPRLICVTTVTPSYASVGDVPYTSCDYIVYYPPVEKFDHMVSFDSRGVKVIVGFNTNAAKAAEFGKLSSWVGSKYAVLDVTIKDDFSDITAKTKEIQDAFSKIKKTYQKPELAIIGIKINPKDADATEENGQKLESISKGALILFQTHKLPDDGCIIGINELMITKKNYEKLAAGINSSVAISTTIAVVKFKPKDKAKTNIGDSCTNSLVLPRTDKNCESLSSTGDKGIAVKDDAVYMCNTNATAQALFVGSNDGPSSWKFNIAFFDIDQYHPGNDTKCPKFKLENFYRKGPRKAESKT